MTRKETLLKEVYAIRNLIAEVKGKEQEDLEALVHTWKFKEEAKRWKEHELRARIEQLGELLTSSPLATDAASNTALLTGTAS